MKRTLLFLSGLIVAAATMAQVPQGISHQAVVRDAGNKLVVNAPIGLQISVVRGDTNGTAVYVESQTAMSNANGLVSYVIGHGEAITGVFADIDWSDGPYFLHTEVDPAGGTDYTISGTTQFFSVPFAFHSVTSDGFISGSQPGELLYWDGDAWVVIPPGQYDQTLRFCNGVPVWGECPPSVPVVTTAAITNISVNSATGGGMVMQQGSAWVQTRGIVWDTSPNPSLQQNTGSAGSGSGTGSFTINMTGLMPETLYYVRAYATNNAGTAYGNQVMFTTETPTVFPPSVSTEPITGITQTSAVSGGNVTGDGGAQVTARGVVWHTSSSPTLENNAGITMDGSGLGAFSSLIDDLEPNTAYYVRAYATNSQGITYGGQRVFMTLYDPDLPTVITAEVTDVTQTSVLAGGEVTAAGGSEILTRGVSWSTEEGPTVYDNYSEEGSGLGTFTSHISGLMQGTTYYMRAFASNSDGLAYGNQVSFNTNIGLPAVEIVSLNSGWPGYRVIDAFVAGDGGAEVTARGFVWDTEENPTLDTNEGYNNLGTSTGEFTGELSGLTPNTRYYVRAYASNSEGIGYSEQRMFHFWDYHDTVSDIESNVYNTVIIGEQEWMTENLRVTKYRNSIPIPYGQSNTDGAYLYPGNDAGSKDHYGLLYNWYAVNDARGLCPAGWNVPTDDDWTQLVNYVVEQGFPNQSVLMNAAGNALKSCRRGGSPFGGDCNTNQHPHWWQNFDGDINFGFDDFGFSALPAGTSNIWVHQVGGYGFWWSNTESSASSAFNRIMGYSNGDVARSGSGKGMALSVRCMRSVTLYNLDLDVHPENAGQVSGAGQYPAGGQLNISASASPGWEFVEWTGDTQYVADAQSAATTVNMPEQDISLTAVFQEEEDYEFSCGDNITFTYRGQEVTYGIILRGGLCWLDRNLGADPMPFVPADDATGNTDTRLYGDLFQWGRLDDGHQDRTSSTTSGPVNQDVPGHGNFITILSSPYDWRSPQNNALWLGEDGVNNPCPEGWRVPTEAELNAERQSWGSNNSAGAYASTLKWPVGGLRFCAGGTLYDVGSDGYVWSFSVSGSNARVLSFRSGNASMGSLDRANGMSVRCVRDN